MTLSSGDRQENSLQFTVYKGVEPVSCHLTGTRFFRDLLSRVPVTAQWLTEADVDRYIAQ